MFLFDLLHSCLWCKFSCKYWPCSSFAPPSLVCTQFFCLRSIAIDLYTALMNSVKTTTTTETEIKLQLLLLFVCLWNIKILSTDACHSHTTAKTGISCFKMKAKTERMLCAAQQQTHHVFTKRIKSIKTASNDLGRSGYEIFAMLFYNIDHKNETSTWRSF